MNFSAVILAGGCSSRMGCDKALLPAGGRLLLARQIELARRAGAREVLISGRPGRDYSAFGCDVLEDRFPDAGPLAGVERALALMSQPLLLVLAVDMPQLRVALLRRLLSCSSPAGGAIPRLGRRVEPLVAFYPKAAHGLAEALLRRRQSRMTLFARNCSDAGLGEFAPLPAADGWQFANWNTPDDCWQRRAPLRELYSRGAMLRASML